MAEPVSTSPETETESGSRFRTILIASGLTVGLNTLIPYTQQVARTISLVEGMIPIGVLLPFLLLVLLVNPLMATFRLGSRLQPWELVAVFSVSYTSIHVNEVVSRVVATFAVGHYMASPENLWGEYAIGVVPPWLVVEDAKQQLAWFYEGLPTGESVPWPIWVRPTFWWLSFLGAVGTGCVAFVSIIRRQWGDQERLPFPFAQVTLQLAAAVHSRRFPGPVKNRLFWIGFSIPASIVLLYIVGYFRPDFPVITVGIENHRIDLGRHVPYLHGRLNFMIVGFAYFTDLQMLFSIWAFWVLTWLQIGTLNRFGVAEGLGYLAGTREQALGGYIVFCVWGLWTARDHLKKVFEQAFRNRRLLDDSDELLSYRTSAWLFVVSSLYMILWLTKGGMHPLLSIALVVFWFLFYIGFTKVIAMTGLVFAESPGLGVDIVNFVPRPSLQPDSIALRQLLGSCYQNGKAFAMPSAAHAARLGQTVGPRVRLLGGTIVVTLLLSLVVATVSTIWLGYRDGAANFGPLFKVVAPRYYDGMVTQIRNLGADRHYATRLTFTGIGALVVSVMTFCQYRFAWWPLHPVAYTLVNRISTRTAIVSVFLTWLIKVIVMRVGGILMYRRGIPLFIGMIVGYTFALAVSMVVDLVWFPGQGHDLFWGD